MIMNIKVYKFLMEKTLSFFHKNVNIMNIILFMGKVWLMVLTLLRKLSSCRMTSPSTWWLMMEKSVRNTVVTRGVVDDQSYC